MQQRQLRLGDILDDYCPRERRVTNHAVVAMVGADVKQTRCTTCDAEHEYKHAKVPRQRRKAETPGALYSKVLAGAPRRVARGGALSNGADPLSNGADHDDAQTPEPIAAVSEETPVEAPIIEESEPVAAIERSEPDEPGEPREIDAAIETEEREEADAGDEPHVTGEDEGPVHRPLIRASLPRPEGQPPQSRPMPEFTIRQPGGRPNRFKPRNQRGVQQGHHFQSNRSNGNVGPSRGGMQRHGGGNRPPMLKRQGGAGGGRKRSK
jgi:hypothetical protein